MRVRYLPFDPTPCAVFYHTAQIYGAFTDLLVLRGRITRKIQLIVTIQYFRIVAQHIMRLVNKVFYISNMILIVS